MLNTTSKRISKLVCNRECFSNISYLNTYRKACEKEWARGCLAAGFLELVEQSIDGMRNHCIYNHSRMLIKLVVDEVWVFPLFLSAREMKDSSKKK